MIAYKEEVFCCRLVDRPHHMTSSVAYLCSCVNYLSTLINLVFLVFKNVIPFTTEQLGAVACEPARPSVRGMDFMMYGEEGVACVCLSEPMKEAWPSETLKGAWP